MAEANAKNRLAARYCPLRKFQHLLHIRCIRPCIARRAANDNSIRGVGDGCKRRRAGRERLKMQIPPGIQMRSEPSLNGTQRMGCTFPSGFDCIDEQNAFHVQCSIILKFTRASVREIGLSAKIVDHPWPSTSSTFSFTSHSFFPIAIFSLNCRTMKTAPLALLAAFCLISYASAQNLIVNGDFETGMITPWTGGTIAPDISFGFNATTSGTLTQTVMTTASTKYLLSADLLISGIALPTATISAVPGAGGAPDGTRTVTANLVSPGFMRVFLLFTASSASTNVNFTATAVPFSSTITVDNVTLFEVEPSKLVGRYGGNIITTVSLTNPELTNKSGRKATARITDDNRIYIIDGSQALFA